MLFKQKRVPNGTLFYFLWNDYLLARSELVVWSSFPYASQPLPLVDLHADKTNVTKIPASVKVNNFFMATVLVLFVVALFVKC